MGNRHPLKAAKIGQITGGGKEDAEDLLLPASHCLLPVELDWWSVLTAKNKVKVVDVFLPVLLRRETTENVTNSGRCNTASYSKASWAEFAFDYVWWAWAGGCDRQIQVAGSSSGNSCPLPAPTPTHTSFQSPIHILFGSCKSFRGAQTNNWMRSRMVCRQMGQVLSAALQSMQEACPHWKTSLIWLSIQMGQVIRSSICR